MTGVAEALLKPHNARPPAQGSDIQGAQGYDLCPCDYFNDFTRGVFGHDCQKILDPKRFSKDWHAQSLSLVDRRRVATHQDYRRIQIAGPKACDQLEAIHLSGHDDVRQDEVERTLVCEGSNAASPSNAVTTRSPASRNISCVVSANSVLSSTKRTERPARSTGVLTGPCLTTVGASLDRARNSDTVVPWPTSLSSRTLPPDCSPNP